MKKILYTSDPATRAKLNKPYELYKQIVISTWLIGILLVLVILLAK